MWIVLAVVAWALIGSVAAVITGSFIHVGMGDDDTQRGGAEDGKTD